MLRGCVICCSSRPWQSCYLPSLVRSMGGTPSEVLDGTCTHVVTSQVNSHRSHVAAANYPGVPVVHPRWLWACYWSTTRPGTEQFAIDFYTEAKRTGTCTALGSRALFFAELSTFQAVEDHVLPHGIRGRCMANLLCSDCFDRDSPFWPYVSRQLQNTTFWGYRVRSMNWDRRRTLLLCLLQRTAPPAPRSRMRSCCDGPVPVLRRLAHLPADVWRHVLTYC